MKEWFFAFPGYLFHFFQAKRKGHGIHSEYIYRFLEQAVYTRAVFSHFDIIKKIRDEIKQNRNYLEVEDHGAGSRVLKGSIRRTDKIYRISSAPAEKSELFFRMMNYLKVHCILELGTNLGVTAMTLSGLGSNVQVHTVEGSKNLYLFAKNMARKYQMDNIYFYHETFDDFLSRWKEISRVDAVLIDGNHRGEALKKYVIFFLEHCPQLKIIIADDITWSGELYESWKILYNSLPSGWAQLDAWKWGVFLKTPVMDRNPYLKIRG